MTNLRHDLLDICIICEGQGTDRFKLERVYRIAASALAAAARQGGDVQQAPAESPQSGGDSRNAQKVQP